MTTRPELDERAAEGAAKFDEGFRRVMEQLDVVEDTLQSVKDALLGLKDRST